MNQGYAVVLVNGPPEVGGHADRITRQVGQPSDAFRIYIPSAPHQLIEAPVLIPGGIAEDQRFQSVRMTGGVTHRDLTELVPGEEDKPSRRRFLNHSVDVQAVVFSRMTVGKPSCGQSLTSRIEVNQLKP